MCTVMRSSALPGGGLFGTAVAQVIWFRLLVDFGGSLVREVMTPRPDIVAIREAATVGDVRALFREQEYSRFPVYKDSLDNIAGFVFIKDLVLLGAAEDGRPISYPLIPFWDGSRVLFTFVFEIVVNVNDVPPGAV